MERSEQINELAGALAKAQSTITPALKDSENPHFKSKFADLASVWDVARGPLTSNGLAVVQSPEADGNGGMMLRTTLMHSSGQFIAGTMPLLHDGRSMQSLGSAITYARRYAFAAVVGIVAELDDDGNAAGTSQGGRPKDEGRTARPPGDGAPSQARPPARPEPGNGRQVREHSDQPRHVGGKAPATGRALFAWCKEQEQRHEVGMIKYVNSWAKLQDYPGRMVDWDSEQVRLAHEEALRKLQSLPTGRGDAYEGD